MSNMYPVNVIAKLFNRTARRVQQLARDGIIPKPENGKYHLPSCVQGYIKHLQSQLSEKPEDKAREQLLQLKCEQLSLKIKATNKESLPTDQVVAIWSDMLLKFRASILAIPYRSAPMLVNLDDLKEIEQIQTSLLNEALLELQEFDPRLCNTEETSSDDKDSAIEEVLEDE